MSEHRRIKHADLARHWGCSRAYVRKLVTEKGLPVNSDGSPAFTTYAEADVWKNEAAPGKKSAQSAAAAEATARKKSVEVAEKTPPVSGTTTPETTTAGEPAFCDVEKFVRKDRDFDALMIEQAERVPQIAYGLLEMKQRAGIASAITAATANWHQAVKAAAGVRQEFLDIQERTRALLPLDQVMDIVGTELQALRTNLLKLGERVAARANPADPALAQAAIDAAMDDVFRQTSLVLDRTRKELAP